MVNTAISCRKSRKTHIFLLFTFVFSLLFFLTGCTKKTEKRLVIWTDNSEFAPFIEVYNRTHKQKAVLVYKEELAKALPPSSSEVKPDIIAGTFLKNSRMQKNFAPLNFLFNRKYLSSSDFYKALLQSGTKGNDQYLLPVSFNIPAMIFSVKNENLVTNNYTISLDELKESGSKFNKKNKKDKYTSLGFAVQSNADFIYTATRLYGSNFKEDKKDSFTWNKEALDSSIKNLKDWITQENTSIQTESDFVYKYLSETPDKQVTSGRTLFSYVTSDKLFSMSSTQLEKLDFRWLNYNNLIPVEDSIVYMGISKNTKKMLLAVDFISWFFTSETQHTLIERKLKTNLDITQFGIAGGFSSLKNVNEHILPVYYPKMITNIPQAGTFSVPDKKPTSWLKIKSKVILPYLTESIQAEEGKTVQSLEERYTDLKKLRL